MKNKNKNSASQLFGTIAPSAYDAQAFAPNFAELHKPFESPGALAYYLCKGCGRCYEVGHDFVTKALIAMEITDYNQLDGCYFEVNSCSSSGCGGDKDDLSMTLKTIPSL